MFIVLFYLTKKLRFCFLSDLKSLRLRAIKSFTDLCTIFLPSLSEKNKVVELVASETLKASETSVCSLYLNLKHTRTRTHTHTYMI